MTNKDQIKAGLENGKLVEGTLYFDKTVRDRTFGYVKLHDIPKEILDENPDFKGDVLVKIMTIRHLNRALHLDKVTIKLCNWKKWERARPKLVSNFDFTEKAPGQE
jgi:hypothetical protein